MHKNPLGTFYDDFEEIVFEDFSTPGKFLGSVVLTPPPNPRSPRSPPHLDSMTSMNYDEARRTERSS